jgi:hypothetical protein
VSISLISPHFYGERRKEMKFECDESKLWAIAIISLAVVVIVCTTLHNIRVCKFIEAGYTRTSLPGQEAPQWSKL